MSEDKYEKNVRPYESALDENASIYQTKEPKTEKQKWKELKGKEKLQYFLEYYGLLAAGIIFGISVVIFFAVHFATKQNVALGILAMNTDGEAIEATGTDYFEDFLKENELNPKKNTVSVNYTMYLNPSSPSAGDSSTLDSIQTLFMTQSIDLFFADEKFFDTMAGQDYMTDLQEFLPQKLLNQYENQLVYATNTETGEKIAAGIRLENNAWLKKTGWYQGTAVVGVADSVKHSKLAKEMILAILKH
jgi:NADH:ubiquinone oxidoreductase subunit 3 (subunit A)